MGTVALPAVCKLTWCIVPDGGCRWPSLQAILPVKLSEFSRLLPFRREVKLRSRFAHMEVLLSLLLVRKVLSGRSKRLLALDGRCGRLVVLAGASACLGPGLGADCRLVHRLEWVVAWHPSVVQICLLASAMLR